MIFLLAVMALRLVVIFSKIKILIFKNKNFKKISISPESHRLRITYPRIALCLARAFAAESKY